MKCKKLLTLITAATLCLSGCSGISRHAQANQDLSYTDMLFDTVIKIQILDSADQNILDGLKKLCQKYDTMFSTTNEDSDLYKLNHAGGAPVTVSDETADLKGFITVNYRMVPLTSRLSQSPLSGILSQNLLRCHLPKLSLKQSVM